MISFMVRADPICGRLTDTDDGEDEVAAMLRLNLSKLMPDGGGGR